MRYDARESFLLGTKATQTLDRDLHSHPLRSVADVDALILGLVRPQPRPYLSRGYDPQRQIRDLLQHLDNPHHGLPCIHIAGSKGKGSTALFLESILRAGGLRVGTFTSPHLRRWAERFRVDGETISDAALIAMMETLRPLIAQAMRENPKQERPAFFDVLTAAAMWLFREAAVDCAVVETGLGGRLDATRVVEARVCCITSIELEHTDKLGATIGAIAREKAGIIRPGVPVVTGPLSAPATAVVSLQAEARNAPLYRVGREIRVSTAPVQAFRQAVGTAFGNSRYEHHLAVPGKHMAQNAAQAAVCAQLAGVLRPAAVRPAVEAGLASARLPGRLELLCEQPWVVIDAAHTPVSTRALAKILRQVPAHETHLLISVSGNRDMARILTPLIRLATTVTLTMADPSRSLNPEQIYRVVAGIRPTLPINVVPDPISATRRARQALMANDLLCVFGSVYLAGLARWVLSDSGRLPEI